MRMQWLMLAIVAVVGLLSDCYIYRILRSRFRAAWPSRVQLVTALLCWLTLVVGLLLPRHTMLLPVMWILFGFLTVYVGKALFVLFDLLSQLPRLWRRRAKRLQGLTWAGLAVGLSAFGILWWGSLYQRFQIQVRQVEVSMPGLPKAFDGLRVAQISDLHAGTFGGDTRFVERLVATIESLHPDVVVFTGDMVNTYSDEMIPFIGTLRQLKAPMGVYAVLGNHDYGDYHKWESAEQKAENLNHLCQLYNDAGWHLLRNSTAWLTCGRDSLALIGVENVGDPPFPTYGRLRDSYTGDLADSRSKILLSHNPSHWVRDIADNNTLNIGLTLSGHTHAMQMEVMGLSPCVLRYPTWGGYYLDSSGQHPLYVNIGAGTVGFPSRVGATPEVTLVTLKSAPPSSPTSSSSTPSNTMESGSR